MAADANTAMCYPTVIRELISQLSYASFELRITLAFAMLLFSRS